MRKHIFALLLLFLLPAGSIFAGVKLPQLFQSGMVLQRNQTIPVWGTADKGETVNVTFRGKKYSTTADDNGKWRIDLPKQKAGGPYEMSINDITLNDILIGDVWMVSGQSNIDIHCERIYPQYMSHIDTYKNDNIRLFQVKTTPKTERQSDVTATGWKHLNKENAWHFSAIGYFLSQKMYDDQKVPQGIIQCSQGGTPIQAWFDADSIKNDPAISQYYDRFLLYTDKDYIAAQSKANARASELWNRMLREKDPGVGVFEKEKYDDSSWKEYNQYDNNKWAKIGGRPIMGTIWLRQHINVDAAHAGKSGILHMGTLHDADETYINGKLVGTTSYQYPPRRYTIPAGLLHEGDNVITVRIICHGGTANFYKDKPHGIIFDDEKDYTPSNETPMPNKFGITLSYNWKITPGAVMEESALGGKLDTQNQATVLYNGMLYPLAPYALQGIVWYQGESNTGNAREYGHMLKKMIGNWRTLWNRSDLPFNIVQLANHMEASEGPQESGWALLREQQRLVTDEDPYATLTCAIDLGEASDIHPLRKRDVAERCALALSNSVFGKKNLLSPEPVAAKVVNGNIEITMDQQLQSNDALYEFEVKGSDGKYHNVKATCEGTTVKINLDANKGLNLTEAKAANTSVRYAYKNNPAKANLRSKTDLPASPFQLDLK